MNDNVSYEDVFKSELEELLRTDKRIVIFGTLEMAKIAVQTISFLGKTVSCLCDNNPAKLGTAIQGLTILSPEEVKKQYPDAKIYICSFNHNSINEIRRQLEKIGFNDIHNKDMIYWVYQTQVIKRPVDSKALAQTINILNDEDEKMNDKVIINTVDFMITEKCTLRCKNCSFFIPYFKNPGHYDKEFLIKSIQELSALVDAIGSISVFGGEPFLHHDLVEICEAISKIGNVYEINIVTNGTILPKANMLLELKRYITSVSISDYGDLSLNKEGLIKALTANNISHTVFGDDINWYENTKIFPNHRPLEQNEKIFSKCYWHNRHMLINGEYHICQISGIGKLFNRISNKEDYINIRDETIGFSEKKDKLKDLLLNTHSLISCDYCNMWKEIPVKRAEQTTEALEF